jgi:hypothetical protein
MSQAEWLLQWMVVVLLLAALPFVVRLHLNLRAIRRDQGALNGGAAPLLEATRLAEGASVRLRASAELSGRQLADRLSAADAMRDDLRYLVERAEALADRLEGLVRHARPLHPDPAGAVGLASPAVSPPVPPPGRSRAERELLRAMAGRERNGAGAAP